MASIPHKTDLPDMTLMDLVMRGNVSFVRRYFDDSLKGHDVARPEWVHLRAAVMQGNLAMARLLVTWGARPSSDELSAFIAERGDTLSKDVKLLRLAGLALSNLDLATSPASQLARAASKSAKPAACDPSQYDINKIPRAWHEMLRTVHAAGAPEALIAGGALRDLYNGRKVHSVDIFVKGTPLLHRSFIKRVAAACPLSITAQRDKKNREVNYKRVIKRLGARDMHQYTAGDPLGCTDTWQIIAGDVTFNIVLLSSELGSGLRDGAKRGGLHIIPPVRQLLERFDIGLCQIAYTGRGIITSEAYDIDAKNRSLTLKRPQDTTLSHLGRIVCKYPDYTLCPQLTKILDTGKLPPRPPTPMQTYTYMSPRLYM